MNSYDTRVHEKLGIPEDVYISTSYEDMKRNILPVRIWNREKLSDQGYTDIPERVELEVNFPDEARDEILKGMAKALEEVWRTRLKLQKYNVEHEHPLLISVADVEDRIKRTASEAIGE